MAKKKSFLGLVLALLLIAPCMFLLTACGDEDEEQCTHIYGTPTYTWSQDNTTCTAERVCTKDATHKESETVNVTTSVTTAQSCDNDEITTYTASFTKDGFATKTKSEKTKDKLGHQFSNTWTFDETGHWKAANCEHSTEKGSFSAHTLNGEGVCDCGYNENEYLFQLFKNIKYLPDYTEDYTYTEIYEKIDSSTDDVNESTQTENRKGVISYDHDTNSAYASYYSWDDDGVDCYDVEYVKHDGDNYFYYYKDQENVGSFSLGDESCAKGICNSKIRYSYFSSDMDFYTDYETFALLLQYVENGNIGNPSIIDMVDNKNGTFSLVEEYDFGTKTFTITFNREKILSMVDEYEYLEYEDDVTYSGSEITTITITYSYDSKTIDDEEIVFPDASELNFLVVDVCIYVNAIGEYIYISDYDIGTAFSLDHINDSILEARNLEIVGLYYDFEHTQPVDIANYKYGYWALLYAEVRPIDGYATLAFEIEYYDDYGYHPPRKFCLSYNLDTNETVTLPMSYTEMINKGVSLGSDTPRYPTNYKIFLEGVEITSENNTITPLENQRVYKIKVEMLPSED